VPGEMRRWVYARDPKTGKKRRFQGLIDRREAEIELWKSEYGDGGEEERPAVLEAERTGGDMEFLKDSFGQSSSLRLVYVGWAAVVGIGWLISTIKTGQIQPLPEGTWEVMGVLTGGKAIQKFAEERK